jgi:hypothetical protein
VLFLFYKSEPGISQEREEKKTKGEIVDAKHERKRRIIQISTPLPDRAAADKGVIRSESTMYPS